MEAAWEKESTIEDIYALPEGERAELIDGHMYMMAPPNRRHQEVIGEMLVMIKEYIREKGGQCKPYVAPFAVFLNRGKNSKESDYVEPDISVVCDLSKLTDKGCEGAPDWVIEVVSLSSRRMDYLVKLLKYQKAGVREYWIVDDKKNRVTVYYFEKDDMQEYSFQDNIPVGIYEGFTINLSGLL